MNVSGVLTPIKQHTNPQYSTPSTTRKNTIGMTQAEKLDELRCLLQTRRFPQALKLFGGNSLMEELVFDHIEIAFFDEALFRNNVGLDFQVVMRQSQARESRVRELLSLRRTRGLNSTVVSSVSSSLEEIIAGRFQPFTSLKPCSTQIFQELYSRLNEIAKMVDKSKVRRESSVLDEQTARELLDQRINLQGKIKRAEQKLNEYRQKEISLYRQICSLKAEIETLRSIQKEHECQKLQIAQLFNRKFEQKHLEYRQQIQELSQAKFSNSKLLKLQIDLQVSVQDFKDLILKLSRENKLLKEQKESLLSKLSFLEQRCLLIVKLYRHKPAEQPCQLTQVALFQEMQLKMRSLEGELGEKRQQVRQLQEELSELRMIRSSENGLDGSATIDEGKRQPKFKRTLSNEQGERVSELKELMRKDQQAIKSLTQMIEELKEKLEGRVITNKYSSASQDNTLSEEISLNFKWRDRTAAQEGGDPSHETIFKQEAGASEKDLAKQNQGITDLMEHIAVINSLEKQKEGVMTPRMLIEIAQLREQIEASKKQMKQGEVLHKKLVNQLRAQISKNEEQIERLRFHLQETQLFLETQKERNEQARLDLEEQKTRYSKLLREKQSTNLNLATKFMAQHQSDLQSKLKAIQNERTSLLAEKEAANRKLEALNQSLTVQLAYVQKKLLAAEQAKSELELRASQIESKYRSLSREKQFYSANPESRQATLFQGDIMAEHPFQNQFLIELLEARVKSSIRRTRLLWKYDPRNRTNFHQYVDGKQQLVMLIELEGNYIVGGYSQGKLYPKMVSEKDGVLFSLSTKEVFEPVVHKKGVVKYDDYYLIFGNSQLRVKSQENLLFSNFGSSTGSFSARGNKVSMMTNSNQKQVKFQKLEIHQMDLLE